MKAVLYEAPQTLSFREVDNPRIGDDGILIKIAYSFICATDIKTYKQGHPQIKPPTILGHEFSGIVTEVGKDVVGFSVGDRVTGSPFVNCGECEACVRGIPEACAHRRFPSNGALAEFIAMSESFARLGLVKLPDSRLKEGALSEPLACVLNSARNFNPRPGEEVLVVGAGFMGLLNALALRYLFGVRAAITDTNGARLDLPSELGIETLEPGAIEPGRFNAIILTPPIPSLITQYGSLVAPFGHLILFGGYAKGLLAEFDPNLVHYKGLKIVGSSGFSPADFKASAASIAKGLIRLDTFTERLYAFDDFDRAFKDALEGRALKAGFAL